MQLAHRDFYQLSILEPAKAHPFPGRRNADREVLSTVEQARQVLDRRVESLDTLLEACHLITPLLNALQGVVFFVKDTEARYVLANLTLAQRCNHDKVPPLLGRTCTEVFPEHLGSVYTQQDRQVLDSGAPLADQLELHLFSSRGPGWCLTHKLPIRDKGGQVVGLAGISHDLPAGDADRPGYEKVAAVDAYIAEHFDRNIMLAELTDRVGLSASQLERYCKRVYQLTPSQIIQKARIQHAFQLLDGPLSITEIGLSCGYSDHSAFSRQFKTITALTPQQYRHLLAGGPEQA